MLFFLNQFDFISIISKWDNNGKSKLDLTKFKLQCTDK